MKLPYETIFVEANRLLMKLARSTSSDKTDYYYTVYSFYLEACGWTEQEFDDESLKRIDINWDNHEVFN